MPDHLASTTTRLTVWTNPNPPAKRRVITRHVQSTRCETDTSNKASASALESVDSALYDDATRLANQLLKKFARLCISSLGFSPEPLVVQFEFPANPEVFKLATDILVLERHCHVCDFRHLTNGIAEIRMDAPIDYDPDCSSVGC